MVSTVMVSAIVSTETTITALCREEPYSAVRLHVERPIPEFWATLPPWYTIMANGTQSGTQEFRAFWRRDK
jgi:hypothetical protein